MIDARSVKRARATNDAVDFVAVFEQQIGEITSVLTGNPRDKRLFHERRLVLTQTVCHHKPRRITTTNDCDRNY